MIHDDKPPLDDALLAHYGIKGMKWGVHKRDESGAVRPRTPEERKALAKKVAIGVGVLALAVGAAYVAKNSGALSKVKISDIGKPTQEAKKLVKEVSEQTDLLHASRFKNKGFAFVKDGGFPSPLAEYTSVFGDNKMEVGVKKLADGRVAASFMDFAGRKDFAGRDIPHQVIVPKAMASEINTLDDVKTKIWPLLKDAYDGRYDPS